jgi:hypothetical protein
MLKGFILSWPKWHSCCHNDLCAWAFCLIGETVSNRLSSLRWNWGDMCAVVRSSTNAMELACFWWYNQFVAFPPFQAAIQLICWTTKGMKYLIKGGLLCLKTIYWWDPFWHFSPGIVHMILVSNCIQPEVGRNCLAPFSVSHAATMSMPHLTGILSVVQPLHSGNVRWTCKSWNISPSFFVLFIHRFSQKRPFSAW